MSEDIRRFLATGGYRSNRSPRRAALVPTSVSPTTVSRAPAKTLKTSRASYPLGRLVPTLDRGTINQDLIPAHDGERLNHTYQRESQAPDAPPSYTGKAELRGEIARASSQQEVGALHGLLLFSCSSILNITVLRLHHFKTRVSQQRTQQS